jgi:hypothetical protein
MLHCLFSEFRNTTKSEFSLSVQQFISKGISSFEQSRSDFVHCSTKNCSLRQRSTAMFSGVSAQTAGHQWFFLDRQQTTRESRLTIQSFRPILAINALNDGVHLHPG